MDLNGVETIDFNAFGGADTIVVNDLSATDLTALNLDLSSAAGIGIGDGASDSVIVNGTAGDDAVQIASFNNGARIAVGGLSPTVNITGAEGANDHLTVNTLGGNDVVDAANLAPNLVGLTVNLGDGQADAATTTTLRTSTATTVFGQPVLLTATVNSLAGTPTGTVTFRDGNTVLGTAPVNAAGQATLTVSLGVGNHALTASFAGTAGFANSTSAAVTEHVLLADANSRFIDRLYQDLLNRPADPAGLAFWTNQLAQGLTRTQVAAGIESSLEFQTVTVQKAYQQFLHRAADPAGLTFWTNFLQQGHTVEQMDAGIVGSAEYLQTRGGGTNNGALAALFQDALGRAIDTAGQNFFAPQLAGGASLAQVAEQVFASAEFRQVLVASDYRQLLNRSPDNAGLAFFTNALANGQTDQQITALMAASDEFFARLQ
jgi:hypothetical protein